MPIVHTINQPFIIDIPRIKKHPSTLNYKPVTSLPSPKIYPNANPKSKTPIISNIRLKLLGPKILAMRSIWENNYLRSEAMVISRTLTLKTRRCECQEYLTPGQTLTSKTCISKASTIHTDTYLTTSHIYLQFIYIITCTFEVLSTTKADSLIIDELIIYLVRQVTNIPTMLRKPQDCRPSCKKMSHSKRVYTMESQSPLLEQYLNHHEDNITPHNIQLPFRTAMDQTSSIFRPPTEFKLARRTNIKYLNQFLKRQVFVIKHKDRWVIQHEGRGSESQKIDELQQKIIRMIRLQNQSELILNNQNLKQSSGSFNSLTPDVEIHSISKEEPKIKSPSRKKVLSLNSKAESSQRKEDLPKLYRSINKHTVAAELIRVEKWKNIQGLKEQTQKQANNKDRKKKINLQHSSGKASLSKIDLQLVLPKNRQEKRVKN